jgi:hypothetical protein
MLGEYVLDGYIVDRKLENLLRSINEDFPDIDVQVEDRLRFYEHHFPNLESGAKTCTIRFKKGAIRVPWGKEDYDILPCFATRPDDPSYLEEMGTAWIPSILVAHVKDFPLSAAQEDGYATIAEMKKDIGGIYNVRLQPTDILSFYKIQEYAGKDWL